MTQSNSLMEQKDHPIIDAYMPKETHIVVPVFWVGEKGIYLTATAVYCPNGTSYKDPNPNPKENLGTCWTGRPEHTISYILGLENGNGRETFEGTARLPCPYSVLDSQTEGEIAREYINRMVSELQKDPEGFIKSKDLKKRAF
jgi:hypothetical protein